jgi:hypothetical protein
LLKRFANMAAGAALVFAGVLMLGFFRLFYDTRFYRYKLFRTKADPKKTKVEQAQGPRPGTGGTALSPGVFFRCDPNPLIVDKEGVATLSWNVTAPMVEIFADSSSGRRMCAGGPSGVWNTGPLERTTIFYLQDASHSKAPGKTLSRLELEVRAPRPVMFTADPNPAHVSDGTGCAVVKLHWSAPDSPVVEIRVKSPDGLLLASGGPKGSVGTGQWVTDGMRFFLYDAARRTTIGRLAVTVIDTVYAESGSSPLEPGVVTFTAEPNPVHVADGSGKAAVTLHWTAPDATRVELRVNSPDGPLVATGGRCETVVTDRWVTDGTVFFLQEASPGGRTIAQVTVSVIDSGFAERELVSDLDRYTENRVAVSFSPQRVRAGEPYLVCIPDFAGQVIDVGYEIETEGHPEPVAGVVVKWCELDSWGGASILTPADHAPGVVRITKVRSRTSNSRWHRADGEIQVAG